MKESGFRKDIILHELKYSIPGLIFSFFLQWFVYYAFNYNIIFYCFYPLVYVGTLLNLGYGGLKALYLLSQLIYTAAIIICLWKIFPIMPLEFLKCPYCKEDVSIFYRWECSICRNRQSIPRYVVDRCGHCKHLSPTFFCGICDKEFIL